MIDNTENAYHAHEIEQEMQQYWESKQSFKVTEDLAKEKFYCLCMFPYPSGHLHMGHVRNYTLGDVIARYQRLQDKNVLQPIGWDAFGLPAENAAIQHKIHPAEWTQKNIAHMRTQFKSLGFSYDWTRELATCDPDYYRWEQWLFIKLYEKGLAYKKNAIVNWDPVDQTVLANEQVVDGKGWRSGAPVERREISQWFFKITAYADELLNGLDSLDGWPEQVRTMQRNWIGRSEGVSIHFTVKNFEEALKVYTTRHDTLLGCTYLAIAPTHPLATRAAQSNANIQAFVEECCHIKVAEADMAMLEKKGIDSGYLAEHPLTGEAIPVWIANYVLAEYGHGAVMAVPAHDQRDWEFAHKYNLAIKEVITTPDGVRADISQAAYSDKGKLINSDKFDGMTSEKACDAIADALIESGKGKRKVQFRLRDWGISRQRYWGTPIPIINCPSCGIIPVPEEDLPVVLPQETDFSEGMISLKNHSAFYNTQCPKCGEDAHRETDTFDTFVESSWYYARFACKTQENAMLDDRAKYWTPVDYYIGGIEHAVMHLLYARFFHKLLRDEDLVNSPEPFINLLTQGMVLKDGAKMSKSKGNTVDPQALINKYGADTVRFFTIFASPPEQSLEWSDSGVDGAYRFLKRIWAFATEHESIKKRNAASNNSASNIPWDEATESQKEIRREIYSLLKKVRYDYDRSQFNTVASSCMKMLNALQNIPPESGNQIDEYIAYEGFSILLRVLAPISPHIAEYLWQELGYKESINVAGWPKLIKEAMKTENAEYTVQVNGKLRAHITLPSEADESEIEDAAINNPDVQRFINDKKIKKIIIINGRKLINLVVS